MSAFRIPSHKDADIDISPSTCQVSGPPLIVLSCMLRLPSELPPVVHHRLIEMRQAVCSTAVPRSYITSTQSSTTKTNYIHRLSTHFLDTRSSHNSGFGPEDSPHDQRPTSLPVVCDKSNPLSDGLRSSMTLSCFETDCSVVSSTTWTPCLANLSAAATRTAFVAGSPECQTRDRQPDAESSRRSIHRALPSYR